MIHVGGSQVPLSLPLFLLPSAAPERQFQAALGEGEEAEAVGGGGRHVSVLVEVDYLLWREAASEL